MEPLTILMVMLIATATAYFVGRWQETEKRLKSLHRKKQLREAIFERNRIFFLKLDWSQPFTPEESLEVDVFLRETNGLLREGLISERELRLPRKFEDLWGVFFERKSALRQLNEMREDIGASDFESSLMMFQYYMEKSDAPLHYFGTSEEEIEQLRRKSILFDARELVCLFRQKMGEAALAFLREEHTFFKDLSDKNISPEEAGWNPEDQSRLDRIKKHLGQING